jgi:pimeloyl-ACP methyl ester carboxylesterase
MPLLFLTGNRQIHYEKIAGGTDRPWLLFLHEGLGSITMWRDFPARLCRACGCRGLLYDRVGHGRSSPLLGERTTSYLHEAAEEELAEIIAELIPKQAYILIGHSDGGSIALIHAAQRPTDLQAVITEAAHVIVESVTLEGIRDAHHGFVQGTLHPRLARYHGDKTESIFSAWATTWLSGEFRHWSLTSLLPLINCPLLAIQGREDHYGTCRQVEIIAQSVPQAEIALLDSCGHTPHREQQEKVLQLMQEFIGRKDLFR